MLIGFVLCAQRRQPWRLREPLPVALACLAQRSLLGALARISCGLLFEDRIQFLLPLGSFFDLADRR